MVVFTCNNCGDSLQKPKVLKHYQFQCRTSKFLTCVDCHKDFRGDEYVSHTKCITENERYGGKDYNPKPNCNKGEKKQLAWINVVQSVLDSSELSTREKNFLNSIVHHENIPRKKAKFINFIKNIHGPRVDMQIVESVWNKMEITFKESNNKNKDDGQKPKENQDSSNVNAGNNVIENSKEENNTDNQKNFDKNETKKSKKRKHENDAINEPAKKKSNQEDELTVEQNDKFNWKDTILEIVQKKGEISLKKLKKKVLSKSTPHYPDSTEEKLLSKLDKKLKKIPELLVDNNIVKCLDV